MESCYIDAVSLQLVPSDPMNNKPSLVQIIWTYDDLIHGMVYMHHSVSMS